MKKILYLVLTIFLLSVCFTSSSFAASATAKDVIKYVKQAQKYLKKNGEKGLKAFNKKKGKWVFKDSYIFIYDCSKGQIQAHPIKPQLIGKSLMGLKDIKGNLFFVQMCNAAKKSKGGWTEYWWPKPGEKKPSRKLSLLVPVKGTRFQVGAGIYNDTKSVASLNKMLK
ncbi:MAG: calcium:proton antiporter [Desulfobacterales bacterium]|nr:calcium:proton antiporter [Desulfobacterales bacterium]